MIGSTIKTGAKVLMKFAATHSSGMLMGIAVTGVIGTAVAASKATPKSLEFQEAKRNSERDILKDLESGFLTEEKAKEVKTNLYIRFAKDMVKTWWPVVAIGGLTIFSMIYAHKIDVRKHAALAAALTITEDRLRESEKYREAVKEMVGSKQEAAINNKVKEDYIRENPVKESDVIHTGHGDTLMLDWASHRYFRSNPEYIRQCINNLNERLLSEMWIDLNDLYSEIGIPGIGVGDIVGWNIDNGQIRLEPSSVLTDDEVPVYVVDFRVRPIGSYKSY
jgi:hypothetical protein